MNLILDIGNSSIKIGIFQSEALIKTLKSHKDDLYQMVQQITNQFDPINRVLISSVSHYDSDIFNQLPDYCKIQRLDYSFKFPFENLYKTPKTLGLDRLALASGAAKQYPHNNVLIIDAGTCMTFDFIDAKSRYYGGAISPGLTMRYKALHHQTAKLPLLNPSSPISMIGDTTESSIHTGVVSGMIHEIEGTVAAYRSKFSDLTVVLTGGDGDFLFKQLKISIFAVSNLLLEGLNHILELNSET